MSLNVGISRDSLGLNKALFEILNIESKLKELNLSFGFEKYELENAICVAKLIAISALAREESIGAHYRIDSKINKTTKKETEQNDKILVK